MNSAKTTAGNDDQSVKDSTATIAPGPETAQEQSQPSGNLGRVEEAKDQPLQDAMIKVRFLNGGDAYSFNRGITPVELRVAVANKLGRFAPEVKIYCFSAGNLVSPETEPDAMPPIVLAVVDPDLAFGDSVWEDAICLHAEASDLDGLRRAVAAVEAAVEGVADGRALLTKVFLGKIGPEMTPYLETLLEAGIDVHQVDRYGNTCLIKACFVANLELVNRLLAAGADVNHRGLSGVTSLIAASNGLKDFPGSGHIRGRIVDRLVAAGAEVDAFTHWGDTSLYIAAYGGCQEVVVRLLAAGADPNFRRESPLRVALSKGNEAIARILREAGAQEIPDSDSDSGSEWLDGEYWRLVGLGLEISD